MVSLWFAFAPGQSYIYDILPSSRDAPPTLWHRRSYLYNMTKEVMVRMSIVYMIFKRVDETLPYLPDGDVASHLYIIIFQVDFGIKGCLFRDLEDIAVRSFRRTPTITISRLSQPLCLELFGAVEKRCSPTQCRWQFKFSERRFPRHYHVLRMSEEDV